MNLSWCCKARCRQVSGLVLVAVGLAAIGLGMFLSIWIDEQLNSGLDDLVILTPDSQSSNSDGWKAWVDNSSPDDYYLPIEAYLFNLTNPEEVATGAVPVVNQVGPFYYKEYKVRLNITWGEDAAQNPTLAYKTYTYYIFDSAKSGPLTENTMVTGLSMAFMTARELLSLLPAALQAPLIQHYSNANGYTDATRLFETRSVHDWIFGFPLPLPPTIPLSLDCPGILVNDTSREQALATGLVDQIYTGKDNAGLTRQYIQWHAMDYLTQAPLSNEPAWGTNEANRVTGSEGFQFARNLINGGSLVVWVEELFRPVVVKHSGEVVSYLDIDMYRYYIADDELLNYTANPRNLGYYMDQTGLINVTTSSLGLPVSMTMPHFLGMTQPPNVIGMNPNYELHHTFLDIEPMSGITMNVAKRLQANMNLPSAMNVSLASGEYELWFTEVDALQIIPLSWFAELGSIEEAQADDFVSQVYGARDASYYIKYCGYIAGNGFVLVGLLMALMATRTLAEQSAPINDELSHPFVEGN